MNFVRDNTVVFYTCIIKSEKSGYDYTGSTDNLRKRLMEHNKGESNWTKNQILRQSIYYEACINKEDTRSRELYLKSGMGKQFLKNRLRRSLSLTG